MLRTLASLGLVALAAPVVGAQGGLPAAQPLVVTGTTVGAPSTPLPSFGSTPGACSLEAVGDPYDPTAFWVDAEGTYTVAVNEPIQVVPATDDTILIIYETAFDPASGCVNLVGIGNETAGSGLTVTLERARPYVLVVAGFYRSEDAYEVEITGSAGSTVASGPPPDPGQLTGSEGWRMLAAPSTSETVQGFLEPLWTQGFAGADVTIGTSNVYTYDETVTADVDGSGTADLNDGYGIPGAAEDLPAGSGLLVYVFADDDQDTTPAVTGFPKTLTASGTPAAAPFDLPISFTPSGVPANDGWTLAGNPFAAGLDLDELARTAVSGAVYVYDTADDRYLTRTSGVGALGGVVGSFQGFWVQATGADPVLTAPETAVVTDLSLVGRRAAPPFVALRVDGAAGAFDTAHLAFVDGARTGLDGLDAYELPGFGGPSLRLFAVAEEADGPVGLDIAVGPAEGAVVGLDLTVPEAGELVLSWPSLHVPADWRVVLTDTETGDEVDLGTVSSYAFSADVNAEGRRDVSRPVRPRPFRPAASEQARRSGEGRFVVSVGPANAVATDGPTAREVTLHPPVPNPTTGGVTLALDLTEAVPVRAEVFDALGRRVAQVLDRTMGAGPHRIRVAPGVLAPGSYIVRVVAGGRVFTHPLTVVR